MLQKAIIRIIFGLSVCNNIIGINIPKIIMCPLGKPLLTDFPPQFYVLQLYAFDGLLPILYLPNFLLTNLVINVFKNVININIKAYKLKSTIVKILKI